MTPKTDRPSVEPRKPVRRLGVYDGWLVEYRSVTGRIWQPTTFAPERHKSQSQAQARSLSEMYGRINEYRVRPVRVHIRERSE